MPKKPEIEPPDKYAEKTGLTLFFLVGGFLLLIMVIGWIWLSTHG